MSTFLLTWNPEHHPQTTLDWPDSMRRVAQDGATEDIWATGNRKTGIKPGSRAFLLRQGAEPRGIVASGRFVSEVRQDDHWDGRGGEANYAEISWTSLVPTGAPLPLRILEQHAPDVDWRPQAGGTDISDVGDLVEALWRTHHSKGHRRAWLVITSKNRQRPVNDGYADDPESAYRWDSTVANSRSVQVGDAIVLWDKQALLGASIVDEILHGRETKTLYRCKACSSSNIKPRKTGRYTYRCESCKCEFNKPAMKREDVDTFVARYDRRWVDLSGALSGPELRALALKPKSQLSMREMDWANFTRELADRGYGTPFANAGPSEPASPRLGGGHGSSVVRVRRGQARFRLHLLAQHGQQCAFSGPCPDAALEAAHLYSYADVGTHEINGGLLLRRDLHRLFDLGEITINPDTLTLDLTDKLRGYAGYASLHGARIRVTVTPRQRGWIQQHWTTHRRAP